MPQRLSSLSAVVNLLDGISHYSLRRFMALAIVGRVLWTSAYLGLGYAVGSDVDAAPHVFCRTWPGCWWRWPC